MRETKQESRKRAAAIRYDAERDEAPRLTAKGGGHVAERIIELARRHDIPVREDKALVEVLSRLDIDRQIPPELYRAVAEILAFVYSANEQYRAKQGPKQREPGTGKDGPINHVVGSQSTTIPSI
ncbi:MAG: Flagellar biosynthetic protein FlhB [Syntrophaceae bacterium PtaB.Bin038]|nr:MAG: Flagellar biosynthetic protein FlhB [Syntrophaceae bacterium PtaB.Bin038]